MDYHTNHFREAVKDFRSARQRAAMEEILSRMTGRSNELLSYEEVAQKLKLQARAERGVKNIPINAIVGSVGRYTDFTRTFLPRKANDEERWARVKASLSESFAGWPPIDVYQVGAVYFVLDGNHRVSIARQEGWATIEARVIEVKTNVPLTPEIQPDDLIIKAEQAEFLEQTELGRLRPEVDLSVSVPGQYQKLYEYIQVHRYFMGLDLQRDVSYQEAVEHWCDAIYQPLAELIREKGLLRWFPTRTETDLYLWMSEHRAALEDELGWEIRPEQVAEALVKEQAGFAVEETGAWRKTRMLDRYTEHIFHEILVPVSGEAEGWRILDQAIVVAQREGARLNGLHLVGSQKEVGQNQSLAVQAQFDETCRAAGVEGRLAIEAGEPSRKILERAILADLVMLQIVYPPSAGISGLASPLRAIISRSPCPVLALPGDVTAMDKGVLAFDGSSKSKEALFVAAYLAEQWKTALTVFTGLDGGSAAAQDYVRQYLELHEIEAQYIVEKGSAEALKALVTKEDLNFVMMGGYGRAILKEMTIGSSVNFMLRESKVPVLICR